jgi:hypothetical protein
MHIIHGGIGQDERGQVPYSVLLLLRITWAALPVLSCQKDNFAYCSNKSGGKMVRRCSIATLGLTRCKPVKPSA